MVQRFPDVRKILDYKIDSLCLGGCIFHILPPTSYTLSWHELCSLAAQSSRDRSCLAMKSRGEPNQFSNWIAAC